MGVLFAEHVGCKRLEVYL